MLDTLCERPVASALAVEKLPTKFDPNMVADATPPTFSSVLALAGLPVPGPETDPVLAAEIQTELAVSTKETDIVLLTALLDITEGRAKRPRAYAGTTRNLIGIQAGLTQGVRMHCPRIRAICDRYLHRLPGRGVNMELPVNGDVMSPRPTLMDRVQDWATDVVESGGKFPRHPVAGSTTLSLSGCADGIGVPRVRLTKEAIRYLKTIAGIVGLGEPFDVGYTVKQRKARLDQVVGWVQARIDGGLPLPCQPDNYSLIDHDAVMAANGPGPDVRMSSVYMAKVAEAREAVAPSLGGEVVDGPPTFRSLRAAIHHWMDGGEASNWANISATLTKARKAFGASDDDALPDAFHGPCDEFVAEVVRHHPLTGKSLRSLERWLEAIHDHADRYVAMGGLPVPMWEALGILARRSRKPTTQIAKESGLSTFMLGRLLSGPTPMDAHEVALMPKLEEVLGAPGGCLVARIGDVVRRLRDGLGSPEFRALSWRLRRLFPDGAETWDGERVSRHAEELRNKALRQDLPYSVITRAAQAAPPRPELSPDMPIIEEYRLLKGHMVSPMPTDAKRHHKARWETQATIDINDRYMEDFALFALTPVALGGLGRQPEQVSMVLFLNWRNVAMWLNFRAGRHAELLWRGKPLGVSLTEFDLQFLMKLNGWLGSRYGWMTQRHDVFAAQLLPDETAIPEPVNLRKLMPGKRPNAQVAAIAEEFCSFAGKPVLGEALVAKARETWRMACIDAGDDMANLVETFQRFKSRKRKVMDPIGAIVRDEDTVPLEWLTKGIRRSLAALPPLRKLYRHACAVRDIVVMVLLITTALRSKNLRELRFFYEGEDPSSESGGIVSFAKDGLDVHIPWDQFKNRTSKELFGEFGDKQDYDKRIGNWFGLTPLFEHYVEKCLPELRKVCKARSDRNRSKPKVPRKRAGGTSMGDHTRLGAFAGLHQEDEPDVENLLFPRGRIMLMDCGALNDLVTEWTIRFVVLDEETGRPIPGLSPFGPHAVRDVVATHIVLTSDDPARFEIAADLLQTGIKQIKTRYSFRDVRLRLAKSDRFYAALNDNFVLPEWLRRAA